MQITGGAQLSRANVEPEQFVTQNMVASLLGKWLPRCIGAVFLYAGALKLIKPTEIMIVATFLGLPFHLRPLFVISLALIEVWLGLALLIAPERRSSRWTAIGCLTVFMWYLIYLVNLADPPSCGCGGFLALFNSNRANAQFGLFRNVMLACALLLAESDVREYIARKLDVLRALK